MLKQRVLTALVLFGVLVAALSVPTPGPAVGLFLLLAGSTAWEWQRMVLRPQRSWLAIPLALLLTAGLSSHIPAALAADVVIGNREAVLLGLVGLGWMVAAPLALWRANTGARRHEALLVLAGLLAVCALWLSLVRLFLVFGPWFLLSLMALIWVADTSAYFAGRAWGRRRLAASVSPGKTVEGAVAGVLAASLWMALSTLVQGSFSEILVQRWGWALMLILSALLAVLSIVGDLFESLLKRRAGMKDSSRLLPGHGGVYDRVDALLPVAPLAMLLSLSW